LEIQNFSYQHIHTIVRNQAFSSSWKFIGFYGYRDAAKRQEGWDILKLLVGLAPKPWVCIGDFNEVTTLFEKLGGNER
jgi:hypothetical protein